MEENIGKVLIFTAPSGAGKTTIARHVILKYNKLSFSISATTREPRLYETNEVDYYFLSIEDFKKDVADDKFLEWEEVYDDKFYGTLKSEVKRIWDEGKIPVFDVDVKGATTIKNHYADNALAIFVKPPSIDALAFRLRKRKSETAESFKVRIDKSKDEMTYEKNFDLTLVNDKLEDSLKEAEKIVAKFIAD